MALLERYRKGSFRGVEFDTFSLNRTKVKKYTEHQYANSDRRYIEERGVQQEDFSVTMSIFGNDDYIEKRDALRKALETEGTGLLVLPLEGEFNVKCVEFSDSQDIIESSGRCDFTATFKVVSKEEETTGNPTVVKNTKMTLAGTVKSLRATVANMVNKNMIISNATSYVGSMTKLNTFAGKMVNIANQMGSGSLSNIVGNFASSIPSFLGGNISILGSAISTLFYTFESASESARNLLSSSEILFSYGDTDASISPTTPQKLEQLQNKQVLNTQIKVSALGIASNSFAQMDFENEEELKQAEERIENFIEEILASDTLQNSNLSGVEDLKHYLKELQVDFSDVVAEKILTTPKIKTVKANKESVSMLAYKYYDSLDDVDKLIDLNNIQNPKRIDGEVRILTDVG